jgi:hypothetical protein
MHQYCWKNGCTPEVLEILKGNIPANIPKYPKLLLTQMVRVRDTIPLDMSFEDMCNGLQKWRESTTTSPSGKHLGIYKSLVKARQYNIYTLKEQHKHTYDNKQNYNNINKPPLAIQCLKIQYLLMTLAVQHCHTYHRWTVVHNFLLEKIPGYPLLDKLRVIHIYEADWSLIQKNYASYKLNHIASKEKTIPIEQAIEFAASRVLTYETIRIQRLQSSVVYNDAKACYDRVIEI